MSCRLAPTAPWRGAHCARDARVWEGGSSNFFVAPAALTARAGLPDGAEDPSTEPAPMRPIRTLAHLLLLCAPCLFATACASGEWVELQGHRYQVEIADTDAERARGLMFRRSEEHTSELQSLMRISYAVFCLKKKKPQTKTTTLQDG